MVQFKAQKLKYSELVELTLQITDNTKRKNLNATEKYIFLNWLFWILFSGTQREMDFSLYNKMKK